MSPEICVGGLLKEVVQNDLCALKSRADELRRIPESIAMHRTYVVVLEAFAIE